MRSILARIIAITAIVPLIPGLLHVFDVGRMQSRDDRVAQTPGLLVELIGAASTPFLMFALACVVEMLFRISERLPSPAKTSRVFWRNRLAMVLLAIAAVYYVVITTTTLAYFLSTDAAQFSPDTPVWYVGGLSVAQVLVQGLVFFGVAAGIEYLSRIADALQKKKQEKSAGG